MEVKICPKHGPLPVSAFYAKKSSRDGLQGHCKTCSSEQAKQWQKDHPKKVRKRLKRWRDNNPDKVKLTNSDWYKSHKIEIQAQRRQTKYAIGREAYVHIAKRAAGCCEICGNKLKRAQLDHDHQTGKIRGLLCCKCNLGLGNFNDDINKLKLAIKYLENFGQ
jgi:hypothetical protein